jgi:putrescine aminotransferase
MSAQKGAAALITLDEVLQLGPKEASYYHQQHLNPRLATLLELVGLSKRFTRAVGPYMWDEQGNRYVDFLCGFGALNLGHNHPRVLEALEKIGGLPNLIEGVNPFAGALAHNLALLAPPSLERVYFANSGAEVVDAAIKLARAATGRTKLVACCDGFHGRTVGALSVMHRQDYREPFAPLLADVTFVAFGDSEALERAIVKRDVGAFIVEPVQGEGGIIVPPAGYFQEVRQICTRYGTLFVADEVQTGLGRTGSMFAVNHENVVPDVLLLGEALGGGLMPISALLTSEALFRAAKGGTVRTPFHFSTFGGNPRACIAAIATLGVLMDERLAEQASLSGTYLCERLLELQRTQPLIAHVRGRGLLIGIEVAPAGGLTNSLTGGMVNRLAQNYLTSAIMMHLISHHRIITTYTLNNPNVLRLEPPLNIERAELDGVVVALEETLQECSAFPRLLLRNGRRLVRSWLA